MRIVLLFILLLPFIELAVLVKVASHIGVFAAIGLIILTSVVGGAVIKHQGLNTLKKANWRMQAGELPATEMSEGLLIAIGGVLFLIPGFVTDIIGLVFLIPFTRRLLAKTMFKQMSSTSSMSGFTYTHYSTQHYNDDRNVKVIEGEVISKDDN